MDLDEVRKMSKLYKSFEIEALAAKKFIGLVETVYEYGNGEF